MTSLSLRVAAEGPMTISLLEDPWPPYIEGIIGKPASGGKLVNLYLEGVQVEFLLMP
jgi:hypothetical protein